MFLCYDKKNGKVGIISSTVSKGLLFMYWYSVKDMFIYYLFDKLMNSKKVDIIIIFKIFALL